MATIDLIVLGMLKQKSMSQYDDAQDFETVWSSIFDLDAFVVHRAQGDPRKKILI